MKMKLVVVGGKQAGKEIPVPAREFVIGRGQDCQLRPQSTSVSRRHCAITMDNHAAVIEDFHSTNGTFVNGERVQKQRELNDGDRVRIGTMELDVHLAGGSRGTAEPKICSSREDEESVIWPGEKPAAPEDTKTGRGLTLTGKRLTETAVLPALPPADHAHVEEALRQQRRRLVHLLRSSEYERQLIAYEIHDGLVQQLTAASMQFQAYARLKDSRPEQAADAFAAGMTMLEQGHIEARRLIRGARAPVLEESGVVAAIVQLVREQEQLGGPNIELQSRVEFGRLDSIVENVVYRIVQEGLTNACKHSKSARVLVELEQRGSSVRIQIQDWGIGFAPAAVTEDRYGLRGIRRRAELLGGTAVIESAPGKGARIVVELPLLLQKMPM